MLTKSNVATYMKVASIETLNLGLRVDELLHLMIAHGRGNWNLVQIVLGTKITQHSFRRLKKIQQHMMKPKPPAKEDKPSTDTTTNHWAAA